MQITPLNPPPNVPAPTQNPGQQPLVPPTAAQAGAKPVLPNAVASPPRSERSPQKRSNEERNKGGEPADQTEAGKRGKSVNMTV